MDGTQFGALVMIISSECMSVMLFCSVNLLFKSAFQLWLMCQIPLMKNVQWIYMQLGLKKLLISMQAILWLQGNLILRSDTTELTSH